MAPTHPTVLSLKQSFLTAQTRLLSQPLTPTRAWHDTNTNTTITTTTTTDNDDTTNEPATAAAAALPPKAVDDALFKLNHRLQQHARRAYAPQATRHVAEQIEQLYWNAADAASAGGAGGAGAQRGEEEEVEVGYAGGGDAGVVERDGAGDRALSVGADLADPAVIATLPLEWEEADSSSQPLETRRYAELAGELHALAERQKQAAARVARLRRMRALLQPFAADPDDDGDGDTEGGRLNGVQENLVTRNGEVETELQRMRMLLARVGGRVGQLKEQQPRARESSGGSLFSDGEGMEGVEMDEQKKLGSLLDRF